jgi:hypothetical protein
VQVHTRPASAEPLGDEWPFYDVPTGGIVVVAFARSYRAPMVDPDRRKVGDPT